MADTLAHLLDRLRGLGWPLWTVVGRHEGEPQCVCWTDENGEVGLCFAGYSHTLPGAEADDPIGPPHMVWHSQRPTENRPLKTGEDAIDALGRLRRALKPGEIPCLDLLRPVDFAINRIFDA